MSSAYLVRVVTLVSSIDFVPPTIAISRTQTGYPTYTTIKCMVFHVYRKFQETQMKITDYKDSK